MTMGAASKYWKLVRIDTAGRRKAEEIASAKAFFRQQFPEFAGVTDVPDVKVQRQMLYWLREKSSDATKKNHALLAQLCLRCVISSLIEQTCIQLELNFGNNHGFTRQDLFPFVLDDFTVDDQASGKTQASSYRTLATEILQTFDPERSSLSTWTTRLVKHHRELNTFLLQHGVYLVSDWAILNDTTSRQLMRVFSSFHHLSLGEIQQATAILESYHAVYRRDRFADRMAGIKGQCQLPTSDQLRQIAHQLQANTNMTLSPEDVRTRLQDIAELLRQYRIYARGGLPPTESLDDAQDKQYSCLQLSPDLENNEDRAEQFLTLYRQQFMACLDQALEKVIGDRITQLQHKKSQTARQFITALHLFHCRGKSMGEIAPLIGLQAQYQVTRLLKLKNFRTDVRQLLLKTLLPSILDKAIDYADPKCLQDLEQQVEIAINEQVASIIQEAEIEVSTANKSTSSLFTTRLCCCLNKILESKVC